MTNFRFTKIGVVALGMFAMTSTTGHALDGGDAVKGESVFKKCTSCHQVGPEAQNKVGPLLTGVFGRAAGGVEGYKYSKSLSEAGEAGLVWNEEEMFAFIADPKKYLRKRLDNKKAKTKMSFRLKKEDERKDVIAYLKTLSPEAEGEATEGEAATTN